LRTVSIALEATAATRCVLALAGTAPDARRSRHDFPVL